MPIELKLVHSLNLYSNSIHTTLHAVTYEHIVDSAQF